MDSEIALHIEIIRRLFVPKVTKPQTGPEAGDAREVGGRVTCVPQAITCFKN